MPQEIKLSQLQDREVFEDAVTAQIAALKAFSKEVGTPRPTVHPLIESCIKRVTYPKADKRPDDFMADYVIVDDAPPPPPPLNLNDRRMLLLSELRVAEAAAIEKIVPNLRRRLVMLQFNAVMNKPPDERTPDDIAIINAYFDKQKAIAVIELASATAEAALEDLTEDNVDSWQVPKLG